MEGKKYPSEKDDWKFRNDSSCLFYMETISCQRFKIQLEA